MARGNTYRWYPSHKVRLLEDVASGKLTRAEAMMLHALSDEELTLWQREYAAGGKGALKLHDQFGRDRRRAERLAGGPQ